MMMTREEFENYDVSKPLYSELDDFILVFTNTHPDVKNLDVSRWDTPTSKDMSNMFSDCWLTQEEFENYDVSELSDNELKDFIHDFLSLHPEVEHLNLTHWDVSNVKDMSDLFRDCKQLKSIDISNWRTDNVECILNMFEGCDSLESIEGLSSLNLSNVKDIPLELQELPKSFDITSYSEEVPNMLRNCYLLGERCK